MRHYSLSSCNNNGTIHNASSFAQALNIFHYFFIIVSQHKKRGPYKTYDDVTKLKIAKYSCENGNKVAVEKFSHQLGHKLSESTVRNMKKTYLEKLKIGKDPDSLPHATRGQPLGGTHLLSLATCKTSLTCSFGSLIITF